MRQSRGQLRALWMLPSLTLGPCYGEPPPSSQPHSLLMSLPGHWWFFSHSRYVWAHQPSFISPRKAMAPLCPPILSVFQAESTRSYG